MKKTTLLLLIASLTACATQRCDPRVDTDPFSTIGCSMNGGYNDTVNSAQKRANLSRQALADLQQQLKQLTEEQTKLQLDLQANQAALADAEAQLAAINRTLQQDKRQAKKLSGEQARLKKQISSLKSRNAEQERALALKKKKVEDLTKTINN
jgi:chromosome segregation ATPase